MTKLLSRVSAIAVIAATALFSAFSPVSAAGNWSWNDVSDRIVERQNRPVWAMAYASPFWYFTDGQELWSGGHVWKTEGSVMSDITSEVRGAGLSRVDDIVSDGQSVLFLKNTSQRNNTVEALLLNGNYSNLSSFVRQYLSWNEGIVSITGSSGTWGIVTSFGRLVLYTPSSNTVRTASIQTSNTQLGYLQNHTSAVNGGSLSAAMQPIQGSWLIYSTNSGNVRFQKLDAAGNLSTVSYPGNTGDRIVTMASNGQNVLIGGYRQYGGSFAYLYNGSTFQPVTQGTLPSSWNAAVVTWNGTSWMVLQEKNLYRLENNVFENLGTTRDLFLTAASNGSGTFLLGGVESNTWSGANPSYPLMLKLAKAQESSVITTTPTQGGTPVVNATTATAPDSNWIWTEPEGTEIATNASRAFRIGAWSANGIRRIEIYTNGTLQRTCDLGYSVNSNVECTQYVYGSQYTIGSDVYVNAKITNGAGAVSWSNSKTYRIVTSYGGSTQTPSTSVPTDLAGRIHVESSTGNEYFNNETIQFTANAEDDDGVLTIELFVNASLVKTCTNVRTCTYTGGPYNSRDSVSYGARLMDHAGNALWTGYTTIYKR